MKVDESTKELLSFVEGCKNINVSHWKRMEYKSNPPSFDFKVNKKYVKILRDGDVHCFIDRENGDVLKAASWNTPAKHARGNIFDKNNGLGMMNEYGPESLR